MKARGFDVPESVVMVTWADEAVPGFGGMTVQVVWSGQATCVIWPPTCALMWPDELKKLDPVTVTVWPARPLAGARAERAGGPPGSASVVEVDVVDAAPPPGAAPVEPPGTVPVEGAGGAVVLVEVPGDAVVLVEIPDPAVLVEVPGDPAVAAT